MRILGAWGLALSLLALGSWGPSQDRSHVVVLPLDVTWGPASPKLPPGALFATIAGDPAQPGEPYVFRAKLPDGYSVPPHWHPMDENVTVVQGVFGLGFGDRIDRARMRELPAGSYAMLPGGLPHYNEVKGETILQFHGIGPYDINYVDAADEPNRSGRARNPAGLRLEPFLAGLDRWPIVALE